MALSDSLEAIGAVSELLQTRLQAATKVTVDVGRPESAAGGSGRKLNLFLYRLGHDGSLRNVSLDRGQEAPLWLTLHYLLTAIEDKDSDSIKAHRLLGRGMAALQGLNFLRPDSTLPALEKNPEPLKISFDEADVETLSKVMQGSEEKYRVSAAFQVRPVMIVPGSLPDYAPLVTSVGPLNQGPEVIPTLGARLEAVDPAAFESGATVTMKGVDLEGSDTAWVGPQSFPLAVAPDGSRTFTVPAATTLSANAYPVAVSRTLASGRPMTSNAVLGHLRPAVTGVTLGPRTPAPGGPPVKLAGSFTINGRQLGRPTDAIFVALFRDGKTQLMLEVPGTAAQTSLAVTVSNKDALTPGDYALVLRVNGEQAVSSPLLNWT